MLDAPPLRAVVFDLDGLMFNTEELYREVGSLLLARRGRQLDDALLAEMMGRPSPVALTRMIERHDLRDSVAQLEAETDEIFADILPHRLAPMPGLIELLEAIESARLPKAIATSSRRSFVDRVLAPLDWESRFRFVLTSEDVTHGKPHPQIYRMAAARLGVDPPALMVLEDSQIGCQAAVAAGTFAVAVPGDHSRHHSFAGAALIASGLADERIFRALRLG
jgi:HAD superfamily hydrolase (TIGR01509 family)